MQDITLLFKLFQNKQLFEKEHPKFIQFINYMMKNPLEKDSIVTVMVKRPDSTVVRTEIKITENDIEIMDRLLNASNH